MDRGSFRLGEFEDKLQTFWRRYNKTWESLTPKQRRAVSKIYLQEDPLTYKEAAKSLEISVDSFQDRIDGAVKKFRAVFPELEFLKETLTYRKLHKKGVLQRHLFDHKEARKIRPLYRVDLRTGQRLEIKPRFGKAKNHYPSSYVEEIEAWAETKCPVPDLLDVDYFTVPRPEIQSIRLKGDSVFRGHGLSNQEMLNEIRSGDRREGS
jgi:predicted DNA-binding protein YlxM (UPF0122 family)